MNKEKFEVITDKKKYDPDEQLLVFYINIFTQCYNYTNIDLWHLNTAVGNIPDGKREALVSHCKISAPCNNEKSSHRKTTLYHQTQPDV